MQCRKCDGDDDGDDEDNMINWTRKYKTDCVDFNDKEKVDELLLERKSFTFG